MKYMFHHISKYFLSHFALTLLAFNSYASDINNSESYFTNILINNIPIDVFQDLDIVRNNNQDVFLSYKKHNDISFYWNMDNRNRQNINDSSYYYQLIGFDKNKIYSNNLSNHTRYTRLRPGKYKFCLIDKSLNIIESKDIIVVPEFYQTWWFKLSLVATKISILVFIL